MDSTILNRAVIAHEKSGLLLKVNPILAIKVYVILEKINDSDSSLKIEDL